MRCICIGGDWFTRFCISSHVSGFLSVIFFFFSILETCPVKISSFQKPSKFGFAKQCKMTILVVLEKFQTWTIFCKNISLIDQLEIFFSFQEYSKKKFSQKTRYSPKQRSVNPFGPEVRRVEKNVPTSRKPKRRSAVRRTRHEKKTKNHRQGASSRASSRVKFIQGVVVISAPCWLGQSQPGLPPRSSHESSVARYTMLPSRVTRTNKAMHRSSSAASSWQDEDLVVVPLPQPIRVSTQQSLLHRPRCPSLHRCCHRSLGYPYPH